jgi:hypothetical protein
MLPMRLFVTTCILCLAGIAMADAAPYTTADGRVFLYVGADHDGLLYAKGNEADNYVMNFDCTVMHGTLGAGEWHWANGGWVIEYDGAVKLGFPRQEAPMDAPDCAF